MNGEINRNLSKINRVLIIDDEPIIAEFVAAVLHQELGLETSIVCNRSEALVLLQTERFEIVISDTLSSYLFLTKGEVGEQWRWLDELAQFLHQSSPDTPLIMMTAYPPEYFSDWNSHGLTGFIAKPFSIERIVEEVLRAATLRPASPFMPTLAFPVSRVGRRGAA